MSLVLGVKSSGVKPRERDSPSISLVGSVASPFSVQNQYPSLRRSRAEHLIEILEACDRPVGLKISHVVRKVALNCVVAYSSVRFLVERKLLDKMYPTLKGQKKPMKHPFFKTTEEGKRVVRLYREVEKALAIEGRIS